MDVVSLYSHTVSTIPGHRQSSTCAEYSVLPDQRPGLVSQRSSVLQPPYPTPCPRCGRDHKPNGPSTLAVWCFAYHPRLGHRARLWTISSPTSFVVDIKESTTHAANLVVLPSRLTLHLPFRVFVCLPLFGCLLARLCCFLPPPIKKMSGKK